MIDLIQLRRVSNGLDIYNFFYALLRLFFS